jgi:Ca2+/Na+ antiporter
MKELFDKVVYLITYIYSFIFPDSKTYPVICFLLIVVVSFFHSKLIIALAEKLSSLTKLSASFIGMTVLTWAGNVGDTLNAIAATKLRAVDLLTSSCLGSQIINIQLCLGVPWLISILKNYYISGDLEIQFDEKKPLKYLLGLFIVIVCALVIFGLFGVNLNRKSGICLTIIYLMYLIYELINNLQ